MDLLKMLNAHVSTDETRYHLCGAQFLENCATATDGHRLIRVFRGASVDVDALLSTHQGKVYSFKNHGYCEGKYPHVDSLIPAFNRWTSFTFQVPDWFKGLKPARRRVKGVWLSEQGISTFKVPKATGLNPAYLAPFAGLELTVYQNHADFAEDVKNPDDRSPLILTIPDHFLAVIMPLRL